MGKRELDTEEALFDSKVQKDLIKELYVYRERSRGWKLLKHTL